MRKTLSILLTLVLLMACLPASAEEYADLLAKAEEYLIAGDLSAAAAVIDAVLEQNPVSPEAWGIKCRIDIQSQDISAIENDIRLAAAYGAEMTDIYLSAAALFQNGLPKKAGDLLAKLDVNALNEAQQKQYLEVRQGIARPKLEQAREAYETKDYEKAFEIYSDLAESGNAEAQQFFADIAAGEDTEAQNCFGILCQDENEAEAVKWFRTAAERGDLSAQFNLGNLYEHGRSVQNDGEAIKWYQTAAEQGYAPAQLRLGMIYEQGTGVQPNLEEAIKWYQMAADQEEAGAQYCLGLLYANGRGVPQSDEEAAKWFQMAADQGDADAQYCLGFLYASGRGVPQSDEEAVKWYQAAADQGHAPAQEALQQLTNGK